MDTRPRPPIPSSIEALDAGWLTLALHHSGILPEVSHVHSVEAERIASGVGVLSEIYRLDVTAEPAGDAPITMIAKLPTRSEGNLLAAVAIRAYEKEVAFYLEAAPTTPLSVPECYYADVIEGTGEFVVLLEDLRHLRSADQLIGCTADEAEIAIDQLISLHTEWWGRNEELAAMSWLVPIDSPIYPELLPPLYAEGWEGAQREFPELAARVRDVGPRLGEHIGALLRGLGEGNRTFLHGDFRADNLLFGPEVGDVRVLDFQICGSGVGPYDLAYFTTQSLAPDVRRTIENDLIDRYRSGLAATDCPQEDIDKVHDHYRAAALFCLVYPVLGCRGFENDRARQLARTQLERSVTMIEDLGLAAILDY